MLPADELEKKIQKTELSIQELSIRLDSLNNQIKELLTELNVSPEQLTAFVEKKENFTEENWSSLAQQRQLLDEKLQRELANIRNPLKAKKTYSERKIEQHWLFVR